MSSITEIEAAIESLPGPVLDELADWLEALRRKRAGKSSAEAWLQHARGRATPGITTDQVMKMTRGEP